MTPSSGSTGCATNPSAARAREFISSIWATNPAMRGNRAALLRARRSHGQGESRSRSPDSSRLTFARGLEHVLGQPHAEPRHVGHAHAAALYDEGLDKQFFINRRAGGVKF